MSTKFRFAPRIRIAAFATILAAALASAPPLAAGERESRPVVALLPIRLLDTSAEPIDQSAHHARRLRDMDGAVADDLMRNAELTLVRLSEERLKTGCPAAEPRCLIDLARGEGADLVFVGVVHKSSTLIMQLWARLVDARTGRDVFSRDLNFRGDNDESWRRAAHFLGAQLKGEGPLR